MKEEDGQWKEDEDDEQERKRTAWEDEQGDGWEAGVRSCAPAGCCRRLMVLMVLLYLLLVKTTI